MSPGRRHIIVVLLWTATIAFWVTIFVLTHLPQEQLPRVRVSDKLAHFMAYGVLAGLLYLTSWIGRPRRRAPALKVLGIIMVYGAIDEMLQSFVGRHADIVDWLYDVAGAVCVLLPLVLARSWTGSRNEYRGAAQVEQAGQA